MTSEQKHLLSVIITDTATLKDFNAVSMTLPALNHFLHDHWKILREFDNLTVANKGQGNITICLSTTDSKFFSLIKPYRYVVEGIEGSDTEAYAVYHKEELLT